MGHLDQFALETALVGLALPGGYLTEYPRLWRLRLDLEGTGPVVEWAGLGVGIDGRMVAYYGPVREADLNQAEIDAQGTRRAHKLGFT